MISHPTAAAIGEEQIDLLRERLLEAEETLRAIRTGDVDALVVQGPDGPRTYTLVTADQSYRLLVVHMSEGALTLAADGLIVYGNSRFAELVGCDRRAVAGQPLEALTATADRASLSALLARARQGSESATIHLRRPDGETVPVQLSVSVLETDGFRGFCAIATDLTAQIRRERQEADERLTRAILEHAASAILVCEPSGHIIRANQLGLDLCGVEGLRQHLDAVASREGLFDRLTVTSGAASARQEIAIRRSATGEPVTLQMDARPIFESHGNPDSAEAWVITLVDITERKRAEAERAQLLEAERTLRESAEQANRAKSDFLTTMSHELRTPLNAIAGHVQLLDMGIHGPVTDGQRDALARVNRAQAHLMRLINDVLNLARVESGKAVYDVQPLRVGDVINDLSALVGPQFRSKRICFTTRVPEDNPGSAPLRVLADRERLVQILTNLLGNAAKFTPPDGRVELALLTPDVHSDRAMLEVRDSGPGIPTEKREAIFEAFVQLGRTYAAGEHGTGLGLAISRDLARAMGGDLTVRSALGEGSTFVLTLPLAMVMPSQ